MKDLKERTVRGALAKICAQAASLLLRVGSLMVLARLLDPKDFGLVAMVTAATGVFSLFKDAGLAVATVQSTVISAEQISQLFWINMLVGAVLALLSAASAPILVAFYREPRLFWVTIALAAGFVFNAAGVQHSALLQREMRFTALALIDILAMLVSTAVGIGMAVYGYGYWALVGMAVILPVGSSTGAWLMGPWVPRLPRRGVAIRSMVQFGGTATLNGLVVYVAYNLEKVLLGRFWGADALGMYGNAFRLVNIPAENINMAVGGVAFSALSRVQHDQDRLRNYFLKGYSFVLAISLPVTIACGLFGDDIVSVFLGPKWKGAVTIFRLLTPTVLAFALINPFWWLLYSVGLAGRSLKIALVIAPLTIAAYFIGLPYGPTGVAFAYSSAMILWVVPHVAWCIHGTVISARDIRQAVSRPLLSGIAAAAMSLVVQFSYGHLVSPLPRLLVGCSVLVCSYLWMLLYVMGQKTFYLDLVRSLRRTSSGN